ncbi:MAG: class I SAM-dependent methyltransferase, partial [Dehalococcoidales bacterium]|nr:class I SAM-dependent methyltransferase [Dehalococcoidales bacterium]
MSTPQDIYYKKTLTFRAWKRELRFKVSQGLFSSFDIDKGTRLLLRTIVEAGYRDFTRVLDLGCGYGPIGLMLKSLYPAADVHMVDRDALAVDYSRQNAELNGLTDIETYASLGYDDITRRDFDLIVSNIPGKAGTTVITSLLQDAGRYLAPGGMAAIV